MWYFWIRRQVRKYTKPMDPIKAESNARILNMIYTFSGFTAFGILAYKYYQIRHSKGEGFMYNAGNSGTFYGKTQKSENLKIYRLTGDGLKFEGTYKHYDDERLKEESKEFFGEGEDVA